MQSSDLASNDCTQLVWPMNDLVFPFQDKESGRSPIERMITPPLSNVKLWQNFEIF
jgi:hypothetical protein